MAFDVEAARKAGYSEAEIMDYLKTSKSGGGPKPSAAPKPSAPSKPKSDAVGFGEVAENVSRAIDRVESIPGARAVYDHVDFPGKEFLPSLRASIKGVADVNKGAKQYVEPSKRGKIAGDIGLGLATAPAGLIGGGLLQGAITSDAPMDDWGGVAKDAGESALWSKVGGEAPGILLKGLGRYATPAGRTAAATAKAAKPAKVANKPAAIMTQLETAKNKAYDAVRDLKAGYTPEAVTRLTDSLHGTLGKLTASQARHGDAFATVDAITRNLDDMVSRGFVTPHDLDELRQVITRDVIESGDDATQRIGFRLREAWDDFMDTAKPGDMAAMPGSKATPEQVALAQKAARAANTKFRKAGAVDEAMEVAGLKRGMTYAGGNIDNALRQEVTSLINPRSARRVTNFTPEEKAAALAVNQGAKTKAGRIVHDTARLYGRSSPLVGGLNLLQTIKQFGFMGGGAAAGAAVGGPWGVAAHIGASSASKIISDKWTQKNVTNLLKVIAKGGEKDAALAARQLDTLAAKNPQVKTWMQAVEADMREYAGATAGAAATQDNEREPAL